MSGRPFSKQAVKKIDPWVPLSLGQHRGNSGCMQINHCRSPPCKQTRLISPRQLTYLQSKHDVLRPPSVLSFFVSYTYLKQTRRKSYAPDTPGDWTRDTSPDNHSILANALTPSKDPFLYASGQVTDSVRNPLSPKSNICVLLVHRHIRKMLHHRQYLPLTCT
jgi:hypothetical protein